MKSNIIVNDKIYLKYKDEILPLSPRLFSKSYFYELNEYEIPLDLKGIENYLSFMESIDIYTTATFIDFVNILLVLDFLKERKYQGNVCLKYVFLQNDTLKKANVVNTNLTLKDYDIVGEILKCLKENSKLPNINLKITGYLNFVNFYNMLIDGEKFMFSLEEVIDDLDENEEEIAEYLEKKYSNMGLNKEFYLTYLKKYL